MSCKSDCKSVRVWLSTLIVTLGVALMPGLSAHASTLRQAGSHGATSGGGQGQDSFFSSYFNFGAGSTVDNIVTLENPTSLSGNLCAMIYLFDTREEMGECCGCMLTPNQVRAGGLNSMIGSTWIGVTPSAGAIQVISALPNVTTEEGPGCDARVFYTPTPTLDAWIIHVRTVSAITGLTEVSFTDNGVADPVEQTNLTFLCAIIVGNGSGFGECSCPVSDE